MGRSKIQVPVKPRSNPQFFVFLKLGPINETNNNKNHGAHWSWVISHVPIEHHATIRYMVYNGYYKVMSNPCWFTLFFPRFLAWLRQRHQAFSGGAARGRRVIPQIWRAAERQKLLEQRWEGSSPPLGMNGGEEKLQPLDHWMFYLKKGRGVVHHKVLGVVKELKSQKN